MSVGADDYIRKSVAVEELKARLISKLRNQRPKLKRILDITPRTTLNTISHEITIDGAVHKLTQKEYELIYHFCHHMNVIHERPALEDLLWPGNTNERPRDSAPRRCDPDNYLQPGRRDVLHQGFRRDGGKAGRLSTGVIGLRI